MTDILHDFLLKNAEEEALTPSRLADSVHVYVESDEEYFDTSEHVEAVSGGEGASVMALVQPSPAVSITTLEGDPPDIEEDCDDIVQADMEGQICGVHALDPMHSNMW